MIYFNKLSSPVFDFLIECSKTIPPSPPPAQTKGDSCTQARKTTNLSESGCVCVCVCVCVCACVCDVVVDV
jgi:hypothetical protein